MLPLYSRKCPLLATVALLCLGPHAVLGAQAQAADGAASTAPLRLRVLTYNIHHGEGMDGKLDLPRIARVIRATEPDLVALQEIDQRTERTGQVDQSETLGTLTGMQVVFGGNIRFQGGDYGNAVMKEFSEAQLAERVPSLPFMGGSASRQRILNFLMMHAMDTYGQLAVYLRLCGVTPPLSRQP